MRTGSLEGWKKWILMSEADRNKLIRKSESEYKNRKGE